MRLIPVKDERDQIARCYGCVTRLLLRDAWADLNGPAFVAYYCGACARRLDEGVQ